MTRALHVAMFLASVVLVSDLVLASAATVHESEAKAGVQPRQSSLLGNRRPPIGPATVGSTDAAVMPHVGHWNEPFIWFWPVVGFSSILWFVLVAAFMHVLVKLSELGTRRELAGQASVSFLIMIVSWTSVAVLIYMVFSVSHTFSQHAAASVHLNPVVPTICIYILKLILAVSMYRKWDGTFDEMFNALLANKVALLTYMVPGGCLALYDLLSFMTLAHLNPAQYQVLLHLRTVLIAFVWQFVMSKRLSAREWGALMSCVFAAMLTERSTITEMLGGKSLGANSSAFLTLGAQFFLAMTGNLSNEKLLKRVPLSVNAQNVILYMWGFFFLVLELGIKSIVSGPVFTMADLPKVLEPSILSSIFFLGFMGISCGYVLKLAGNIVKELAGMVVTMTVAVFDWWVLKISPWGILDILAVLIISVGLGLFALLGMLHEAELAKKENERLLPMDAKLPPK